MSDDAFTIIEQVRRQTTFDEIMRRDPNTHTDGDRLRLVELLRQDRAAWQARQSAKQDKEDDDDE